MNREARHAARRDPRRTVPDPGTTGGKERGFALPVAIFALVVVGVLVTGGFFMSHQESRIGVAGENSSVAFYIAERGIHETIGNWDPQIFDRLDQWQSTTMTGETERGQWTVTVTRTGSRTDRHRTFFLDGTGTVTEGGLRSGATRQIGLYTRLWIAGIEPPAAVTTQGDVRLQGSAQIDGNDQDPDGWGDVCDTPEGNTPGVITSGHVDDNTNEQGGISGEGDPPYEEEAEVEDDLFSQFGDLTWDDLVEMASIKLSGGSYTDIYPRYDGDGRCDTSEDLNWGETDDPADPCGFHFPMIHINGNANIQSDGRGQGILLVDGDLDMRGSFTFNGIIIVQGTFETQGGGATGPRVNGGVMAANANLETQSFVGSSVVRNSRCAIEQALLNNSSMARPVPIVARSWVDLSSISFDLE